MESNTSEIEALRERLDQMRRRKSDNSAALLSTQLGDDERKALLNENAALGLEIAELEERVRALEFPESTTAGEPINPWLNE